MEIRLSGISKRFTNEWIFRNFSLTLQSHKCYAFTGPNGSGKSTMLMILAGWLSPSDGLMEYYSDKVKVDGSRIYRYLDFVAPYLELIEDFTLLELVRLHFRFNPIREGMMIEDFIHAVFFDHDKDKFIRHFSSGMKQRLKLALGIYSQNPVLFLDEPTSNLDENGKLWFSSLFDEIKGKKLIIMASNQQEELHKCDFNIKISDYRVAHN